MTDSPRKPRMFPVRLLHGYVPASPYVVYREGRKVEVTPPESAKCSIYDKVEKGALIELPIDEAKAVIAKGIGERGDGLDGIS